MELFPFILIGLIVFIFLAYLPGSIARARRHRQADAIALLGWFGLLTFGVASLVALVWAMTDETR